MCIDKLNLNTFPKLTLTYFEKNEKEDILWFFRLYSAFTISACFHIHIHTHTHTYICVRTRCLRKNCAKLVLSELCKISINCNNLWLVDGKMAEIICYTFTFHLTSLILSHYLVKHKSTKFYI